jgi:hypothetical protein
MSASYVRTQMKLFLDNNLPAETYVDLTAESRELRELLDAYSITRNTPWLGLQFIGNSEEPITIPARNDAGKYREIGAMYIHVVDIAKIGAGNDILTRVEAIRNLFRGRRIGDLIKVESVTPPNFEAGATLQFEGGWTSASVIVSYEYDIDI